MSARPTPAPPSAGARLFGPWVDRVDAGSLRADALAGLLGAVLLLPQAIAFATLAGLPPEVGLATAMLPCVVAALFGSSWQVVSGPTNALSLALVAMLAPLALPGSARYVELAFALTLMVGLLQLAIGGLRLGAVASFISPAALLGFTSGAALLIAVHALKDGLGLTERMHGAGDIVMSLLAAPAQIAPGALAVALATAAVAFGLKRLTPRAPALLLGVVAGSLLAALLNRGGDTVRMLGAISLPWPLPHWPQIETAALPELLGLALPLTLVALAQQVAIAKAVAARTGQRLDTDREFLGQGLANVVGGLSSSYVACGSINRSMPNLEAGARTPLAAAFSALWLALLVLLATPWLAWIPYAAIAGLLLVVAAGLLDLPRWRQLRRVDPREFAIALATLAATVTLRLEVAILLGSLLSLGAYLHRTAKPAMRSMGFDTMTPARPFVVLEGHPQPLPECPQLKLLRMEGAVYFGAAAHVSDTLHALRDAPDAPRHLLVMCKSMNFIDPAGVQIWNEELAERRALGGDLYFHRPRPPVLETWQRAGFLDTLGPGHVFPDKHHAIAAIVPRLDEAVCARCTARVFFECAQRPGPPRPGG